MPSRPVPADRELDLDSERGLTTEAVAAERARSGPNDILVSPPSPWLALALDTARDPMLWFLVAISALFTVIGDYAEATILAVALVPLVGMDLYLHRRTQASTQGLATRLAPRATVVRGGIIAVISARDLVPGDLVEVAASEHFPADGVVLQGSDLQVDESSLTGESYPARKQALTAPAAQIDTAHWVFAGTRLIAGRARLRVIGTGATTLYGEIVRSALLGDHTRTPLQASVARLVAVILGAALVLCVALAAIRLAQGKGLVDAAISAMTLAIAALPEEFPVALTFFLGVGVYRLARRQALVRRAVVVENIGRVTCICTDKTGTLTAGTLRLSHRMPVAGTSADELVAWAAATAADVNDPLDRALHDAVATPLALTRQVEFAFTEQRRRATAIVRASDGDAFAITKGAPETVLALCADPPPPEQVDWRGRVTAHAAAGRKVIAIARAPYVPAAHHDTEPTDGYALLGLIAFEDPIRDGVRDAVLACADAGIRVIMLTGDHPGTAEAIARGVGLGGPEPHVISADALDGSAALTDVATLRGVDAVARATPAQKLALVQALQRAGEIVAVTGDGVNDVPALQTADVGIAMGERGTQSAREVASIVLLDDNFRTIVRAIGEGRQLKRNLRLAFAYLLLIHIAFVVSAATVPLLSNPLLYLPIHIVWLELIIHPTALLVFQDLPTTRLGPVERDGARHFFAPREWLTLGAAGFVLAALLTAGFEYALGAAYDVEHARALTLAGLVAAGAAMTAVLSRLRSRAAWISTTGSLGSLVLLVQAPRLAALLHLRPLHAIDWAAVGAVATLAALLTWRVRTLLEAPRGG